MSDETRNVLALVALACGVGGAGWSAYLGSKVGSLGALWKWKDDFAEKYARDRLSDAKEYATKMFVMDVLRRLEDDIKRVESKLDAVLDLRRRGREEG